MDRSHSYYRCKRPLSVGHKHMSFWGIFLGKTVSKSHITADAPPMHNNGPANNTSRYMNPLTWCRKLFSTQSRQSAISYQSAVATDLEVLIFISSAWQLASNHPSVCRRSWSELRHLQKAEMKYWDYQMGHSQSSDTSAVPTTRYPQGSSHEIYVCNLEWIWLRQYSGKVKQLVHFPTFIVTRSESELLLLNKGFVISLSLRSCFNGLAEGEWTVWSSDSWSILSNPPF